MTGPAARPPRRRWDHLPHSTSMQRFNRALAIRVTAGVGSMWCAYLFAAIALVSLPAALSTRSVIVIVSWVAQTFFQLVLLSVIIVGQNVTGEAADARAAETYADVEAIKTGMGELRTLIASTHDGYAETIRVLTERLGR